MVTPDWSLAGHTALITGGAGGIGQAVAADLLSLGARVVVADVSSDRLAAVGTALGVATAYVDLADDESIDELAASVRGQGITILVNSAGLAPDIGRFLDSDRSEWDRLYRVNQRSAILLTQLMLPAMIDRGFGRIIHVASDTARAGAGGEAVYAATKASLLGFAKSVAREVARHGVTSNVVCPGPIRTPMFDEAARRNPELEARMEKMTPMRRIGEPEEVSAAITWLASPRAGYVTGQVISVSGGITMN
jgi:2-hydroxycyclohexanecarboxyl-CoA dehydrogenase